MSTEIQPPAPPVFIPRQRTNAYTEGQADAFDEPQWIVLHRIAELHDCATTHGSSDAQRWAADYAAGAHNTWRALKALHDALDTLGVQ